MSATENPQHAPYENLRADPSKPASDAELAAMVAQREAYLDFLGLERNPFPVAPDAETFFLPARIDALITETLHSIYTRKGFMVITGEVGLGKTTISQRILRVMDHNKVETALVFNTYFQGSELIEEINKDFGLPKAEGGLPAQMAALNTFLMERYRQGKTCAIIIDDAQNLSLESLEMVRMISNLETNAEKLVQILLVGQPELHEKLNAHEIRQLKSRIVLHAKVRPFDSDELKQYIHFRLNAAGSRGAVTIADNAFKAIEQRTGGNPRQINNLMDRCLYGLFAYNSTKLTRKLVLEVADEVGLSEEASATPGGSGKKRSLVWPVLASVAVIAVVVLAVLLQRQPPPQVVVQKATAEEMSQLQMAREQAKADMAKAQSAQQQARQQEAQAQQAKESARAELNKAKTLQEKAKALVAKARMMESKALAQAAEGVDGESGGEAEARLSQARQARVEAEREAVRAEALMIQAQEAAKKRQESLDEARKASVEAEAEVARTQQLIAQIREQTQKQKQALEEATLLRQAAEAEAEKARAAAQASLEEAKQRAAEAEREAQALEQAKAERQAAEAAAEAAKQAALQDKQVSETLIEEARKQAQEQAQKLVDAERQKVEREAAAMREAAQKAKAEAEKRAQTLLEEAQKTREEAERLAQASAKGAVVEKISPELQQFMAGNGLENYATLMSKALRDGWLPVAARRIGDQTGKRLAAMRELPKGVSSRYGVLTHKEGDGRTQYLFFWKPEQNIDDVYYGSRGADVKRLQSLLKRAGHYPAEVDGIAGRYTIKALVNFQRQYGLEPTGQINGATLYLLENQPQAQPQKSAPKRSEGKAKQVANTQPISILRKPPARAVDTPDQEPKYLAQAASFQIPQQAITLATQMRAKGIDAFIQEVALQDGVTWLVVRAGPWAVRAKADKVVEQWKEQFHIDGLIIHYQPDPTAASPDAASKDNRERDDR
ncbi:AAA family ATPase [Magnetofaba australis]|uniref:SPOR domain-containing protein n=1 Tax=Magnetofaba australis IT-1 TaxID=1434232 RepID=A0A1Y2K4R9_9PROT|nr:AAA family ATPase [Magnetofaba australis]OSM04315.1 hypothetical protein MAIT1_04191 [Magnetofaba australis IT-1]